MMGKITRKCRRRLRTRTRLSLLFAEKNLWGEHNVTEPLKWGLKLLGLLAGGRGKSCIRV